VTKKTIQFKLPAMTAEPDRSTRELDHAGEWVEDVVKKSFVSAEPIGTLKAEPPAYADNDQRIRPEAKFERPDESEPFFAAGHPSRDKVQTLFRCLGDAADCGVILTLGVQAISREWLSMPLDAAQRSFNNLQALHCRSLSDLIILQTSLMRSNIEDALARGGRVARISLHMMGEATRKMTPGLRGDGRA
jgi:hypothetical protein